ncbi:MAG: DUF4082 domain-containing protein [Chitinophagaceae bacterium]|nr:MAG: DUF4082 domain-containing protein [Chitinophagaceae bacterium]
MKYCLVVGLIILISGCGVLQNGVSYSGEDKIFTRKWKEGKLLKRIAYGREPGWELGFSFITTKESRLRGIWIQNPVKANIPVSIWDATTKQLLHSFSFRITDTLQYNHFILQQPVPLEANRKYCISMNVTGYYYQPLLFAAFPFAANNCSMISSVYEETHYPRYPSFEMNNLIHGLMDIDLDFKQ